MQRCPWCGTDELYVRYHDLEWGVPVHDDQKHFEFLVLEGAQAGLSWLTVLRKRENYRLAFDGFDPQKVARYDAAKITELLNNSGIIRNRLKIQAALQNAQQFLKVQQELGSFDRYIWQFVDGKPVVNHWERLEEIPAKTPLAEKISRDLILRGFKFVGPTIMYAHLQAIGVVNDHLVSCFRYPELIAATDER